MLNLLARCLRSLDPRRARCADEQGSVVVVVVVIATLSVAVVTLLATVQSNLGATRTDDDRTAAFQRANGGIDHALYRFDRSEGLTGGTTSPLPSTAVGNYVPTVNAFGELLSFTDFVTVTAGTDPTCPGAAPAVCSYTITATADPPGQTTQYRVTSVGVDSSGRQRQAVATLSAEPLFRDGFFTLLDFTLTGNQTTPIAYRSAINPCPWGPTEPAPNNICSAPYSGEYGPWPPPIDGSIGTNGTFSGAQATVRAFAERWESFNMYGRSTFEAADEACAEGECTDEGGEVIPFTDQKEIEIPDMPPTLASGGTLQSCPNGGQFTGTASIPYVIPPGDYTCPIAAFSGVVNVGTGGNGRVRIWPTSRLRFASASVVNRLGYPKNLQIYYPEPSDPASNDSTICNAEVWALLYTPGLNIACNGAHQPEVFGAVVARLHGGTGNQFEFHWDMSSQLILHNGKYRVIDWRECPVGSIC